MEISELRVIEDITNILKDEGETAKLAGTLEKSYTTLYHNLNSIGSWKDKQKIEVDSLTTLAYTKDKKGNSVFEIQYHNSREGEYGVWVKLRKDGVMLTEASYCFSLQCGNFEKILRFYSKYYRKKQNIRVAKRIKSLITIPEAVLEKAKEEHTRLQKLWEGGGLEALLQQSKEKLFDIKPVKDTYSTNPEAFKQLFEAATEEQKKMMIQELIRSQESNKELNKWLEDKHKEITDDAWREQFLKGNE